MVRRACRAALAQLVRALDCGSRGPPFDPGRRYHHYSTSVPDYRAPVEDGPQEAHPVPYRLERADRPDDGQRFPPVRRGDGEALDPRQHGIDRLEASLTAAAATRRRLLDALLVEALAPAAERELEAAE